MPYDAARKLFLPDFQPEQQQGWVNMPDDAPIDAGPAVGAFKQRFLSGGPAQPDAHGGPMGHMDAAPMVAPHEEMGSMMGAQGADGNVASVKPKSL
jgi:hypothetical protein